MKTLSDFPQFTVQKVETTLGDAVLLLTGKFDRLEGVQHEGWDYLVQPRPHSMPASVVHFDETTRLATYNVDTDVAAYFDLTIGSRFAWVSSYWDPRLIWSILQGPAGWSEQVFAATDAYAWADGRAWTNNLDHAKKSAGSDADKIRAVPGGWDHEHCTLCDGHITPGDRYWMSAGEEFENFLCSACYQASVPTTDLGLLFG